MNMKPDLGWWFPGHETHLQGWMRHPKNQQVLNGRAAYQGKKQAKAMGLVGPRFRVAVDVGGHIGLWSYNLAHWFSAVVAFEPVALHRECFVKNLQGVGQYVTLHPYALGAAPASVSMDTEDGSSGNTTVGGAGDIPMRTLDSFGLVDVDFMKLDCEGYEELALRGGEATITASWPVIVVEQKRDHAEKMGLKAKGAVEYLKSLGYSEVCEMSGDHFMVHK